jgi:diacylglycerol kinase family enzyme
MGGLLLINPRSGSARPDAGELADEARARGIGVHLLRPGEDPGEVARARPDADALGMAGGDGSLAAVAEAAIERELPLVCVPFGTRNHFARDVGLDPGDPIAALDAFVASRQRRVDVGRAGDRLFLNNVSFGVYARLVHRRERHRRRREALARIRALLLAARRHRPLDLTLDGEPVEARVLLVSNNRYALDLFSLGERPRLDEGRLYVYRAAGLLPRRWDGPTAAHEVTIGARHSQISAAIDGEPVELRVPLRIRIEPQALRVLVPQPE